MVQDDFYPAHVREAVEASALRGEISEGYVNRTRKGPAFAIEPKRPLARIRVRAGGQDGPTKDELEEQARLGMPMVVVRTDAGAATSFAWGDYLLDYPLMDRPFIYGVFDCYEALRSWVWQNERVKLAPIMREALWWQAPIRHNENLYLRHFKGLGYSEVHVRLDVPEGHQYAPRIGDGVLFQMDGSPVVNHAAVYIGDGQIYQHLIHRESETSNLRRLPRSFKIRKWIRRTDKLNPGRATAASGYGSTTDDLQ